MIRTQGVHFLSGIETRSFIEGEVMDGLWLVLVQTSQTMKVVMSLFLCWRLEMACELIGATKQKEGVKVLQEQME